MDTNIEKRKTNHICGIVLDWNSWFIGSPDRVISSIFAPSITLTNNTIIQFTVFQNIASSITLLPTNYLSLCIEDCSFIDCFRNDNYGGGAIYFFDGEHCVLNKVCVYQCFTAPSDTRHGQFCYIKVKSEPTSMNVATFLSMCKCAPSDNGNRMSSVYFYNGNISLNNFNSSDNRCYCYSGLLLHYPYASYTTQSTFYCNNDTSSRCVVFYVNTHHMSYCNIIKNHQNQHDYGTVYNYNAETSMMYCVIDLNTPTSNCVVFAYSGCINLSKCFIQLNRQINGSVNIQYSIHDNRPVVIPHFASGFCFTQNDIEEMKTKASNHSGSYSRFLFDLLLIYSYFLISN